ncbi:hypothetical protein SAMN06297280_3678 [Arsukibacterium tuosuense]|uniref:Uncharacterized protein n=1 Tax=Arsukibacterium tuosuense TaxID=1323745 RepID=A0A285JHN7_9GAMM|nr:hypothetical protein [Arsukibacterium tuosuense]SNY59758.1 hypothetical protein SAMN06297280_3678 [Arsukibacterium tuosuense]
MLRQESDADKTISGSGQQILSAVTHPLTRFISEYGNAVLLALLIHGLIFALLLSLPVSQHAVLPPAEPIASFLYQPPPPSPPSVTEQAPEKAMTAGSVASEQKLTENAGMATPQPDVSPATPPAIDQAPPAMAVSQTRPAQQSNLAQRALNRVAEPDQAAIDRAATASYQQFIQQQQQPKLTVDKQHWPISQDPKAQVVAQLDDGLQIIRTKDGCRIGDPSKDGFAALMAAKRVPCGDEISTRELLKQALDKHIKR